MNIEQAKIIPLTSILEKLNCYPVRYNEKEAWYLSPFRQEKTASFHVLYNTNRWHDFGEGIGGDTIDLVQVHLTNSNVNDTVADALRWIDNMVGQNAFIAFVPYDVAGMVDTDKTLELKHVGKIANSGLIRYLEQRGIDFKLAKKYLKQLSVLNKKTGKTFETLGLQNEENGYELRNPFFKGCVRKKHITFIRGSAAKPDGIHIFEGMFDYLTFLTIQKQHEYDVIILNSLACLNFATPYIKGYGYKIAATWLDNDLSGQKATEALVTFFKTEANLIHKPMNKVYADRKDLNAWHMRNLNLFLLL